MKYLYTVINYVNIQILFVCLSIHVNKDLKQVPSPSKQDNVKKISQQIILRLAS